MRLLYVTSRFPYGPGEAFLAPEVGAHLDAGVDLRLFPMLPKGGLVHVTSERVLNRTDARTLGSWAIATGRGLGAAPASIGRAASLAATSSSWAARMRNALVIPRTAALVDVVRRFRPTHIHAHWGGASSTIALVAAEATDVPWSMTLHRWDIHADNQLARKIASACFTRTVSESGAAAVRSIVPEAETAVIHMGVDLETVAARPTPSSACRLVCIGGLVPVKNHSELLRSFAQVVSEQDARLDLVGSGPLANDLRSLSASLGVEGKVRFLGVVAHDELLARLRRREWDGVVLASTASGSAHEGIPVSLMEAMAAGVPVIATDSGGTHELLTGRAGILVPLDDQPALVETLLRFVSDRELREQLSSEGRRRVADAFDARVIAADLRHRFATCAA